MKIAILSSIYPQHAQDIYRENPLLHQRTSDEQMEYIRWHALSSYTRWNELLTKLKFKVIEFVHNLPTVEKKWAKENQIDTTETEDVLNIGLEKVKRFEPDILYCTSPVCYIKSSFLKELISILPKRPKIIAWYGADCGKEEIFQFFDLTLSNSKHLVNSLRNRKIPADFLQHSFEPAVLDKIKIPEKRINRVGFFGNLDVSTYDFKKRTELLRKIFEIEKNIDVHGTVYVPKRFERYKYSAIKARHDFSRIVEKLYPLKRIKIWSQIENLPPNPWPLGKKFTQQVKPALFGQKMLQALSNYQVAFNYHNKHTGNYACNMRLFEATGVGCCLLTDNKSDINSIFEPDSEIVTFSNPEDAISKVKFLIKEPKLAKKIALAGQKRTLTEYTAEKQVGHFVYHLTRLFK